MAHPSDRTVSLAAVEAALELGGCWLTVTGTSMVPFLRHKKDKVYLTPTAAPLHRGDIIFYVRKNGAPILHRIHKCCPDGTLLLCGDNQTAPEPVQQGQVLALVSQISRDGRIFSVRSPWWRLLSTLWRLSCPIRGLLLRLIHRLARIRRA